MTKVIRRTSKTHSFGSPIFEGDLLACGEFLKSHLRYTTETFLEIPHNKSVATRDLKKERDMDQDPTDEELYEFMYYYFTTYFSIV